MSEGTTTPRIVAVIAAAGSGERLGGETPKPWRRLGGQTLVERAWRSFMPEALDRAGQRHRVDAIIVAVDVAYQAVAHGYIHQCSVPLTVVVGGATRTESVRQALRHVPPTAELVAIHDAARPFWPLDRWDELVDAVSRSDGAIFAIPVSDTLKRPQDNSLETVDRSDLWAAQTPQVFRADMLRQAHEAAKEEGIDATDDAELVRRVGGRLQIVRSTSANFKITDGADWSLAERVVSEAPSQPALRIGFGYDAHRLGGDGPLMLGGVMLAASGGLIGNSDGDVLLHAICDALLGAAALGDIGHHFPPDDPQYRGCDSREFVRATLHLLRASGFAPSQVDATVMAEAPKLTPHVTNMRETIAADLGIDVAMVSVKATTTEGMGFVGRREGIVAQAVVTIRTVLGSQS